MLNRKAGLLMLIAYLSFIALGTPEGMRGVAWPSMRGFFNLTLDATLGELLLASTSGYMLSSFTSGRIVARMGIGMMLSAGTLALAVSLIGMALAPAWWVMVGLGFLYGLGGGTIDGGLNYIIATQFSARWLNWLHACYGIGATIGPLIMTVVLGAGQPWQLGYLIVGGAQIALAASFAFTRLWWQASSATPATAGQSQTNSASLGSTLRLPAVWLCIALFFAYAGVEFSAGQWAYSVLTGARGIAPDTAGTWVSLYWAGLTLGRLGFGFIVGFAPLGLLLRLCAIGIVLGAALFWLNLAEWFNPVGLVIAGACLGPLFPSLIGETPGRLGEQHTANGVGFQIAGAVLGGAVLPSAAGFLADRVGLEVIAVLILGNAIALWLFYEAVNAMTRKPVAALSTEVEAAQVP